MHYRNGREAKVGDKVVGTCYNTKGIVVGTLVSITPSSTSRNAMVAWLDLRIGSTPLDWHTNQPVHVMGTADHGAKEPIAAQVYKQDYTQCDNLWHADDVAEFMNRGPIGVGG